MYLDSENWLKGSIEYENESFQHLGSLVERTQAEVVDIADCPDKLKEIEQYLQKHPKVKRYVILTDCDKEQYEADKETRKHLVVVDAQTGLQMENLIAVCEIMNMQK